MVEIDRTDTSPSLLIRIRDPEDSDAWGQFLALYTSIVRDYCIQRRLQPSDVDDLAQDVMTAVANSIRTFEYDPAKGRFRAWLGTVTANKIKSFLLKQSRRGGVPSSRDHLVQVSNETVSDPDSEWVSIFSERIFSTACARIRSKSAETAWACFEASWIRKSPASEVAETLGIPVHQVYVNTSRIMKRLESEVRLLAEDSPVAGLH
ncbi:MAG: sigma-70 family RNA polymerase sigma factor [Planctomycetota bacterium]